MRGGCSWERVAQERLRRTLESKQERPSRLTQHLLGLLQGRVSRVAAGLRQSATKLKLPAGRNAGPWTPRLTTSSKTKLSCATISISPWASPLAVGPPTVRVGT
jgi:hypothetical protein